MSIEQAREKLQEMLENINDEYDKSEGSFFYDVLMPVAIELAKSNKKADEMLDKGFADTATDEWLDKKVAEQGLTRKQATKATGIVTISGSVGAIINIGDKVASDVVEFVCLETKTIDETGQITANVQCEVEGTIGNVPMGAIKYFPITIGGLTSVTNESKFDNAYNAETDEELRKRYFEKVQTPATSGNKYHYRNWAKEVIGVGDARVFSLWNGNGSVKVVLIDSNKTGAEQELIDKVITNIENNRPIGATVTVVSAIEKSININVNLTVDTKNYTVDQVKNSIENNIITYLKEVAFIENYISYAKVGSIIFNSEGVIDYSDLQLNNGTSNVAIVDEEVAILGGVTIG